MKKIKFHPTSEISEHLVPPPKPAISYIPQWYKDIKRFKGDANSPEIYGGEVVNKTVKSCMPFLDALSSGYIQETWCDIEIKFVDGQVIYNYSNSPQPLNCRDSTAFDLPTNFIPNEFVWLAPWMPELESGYSALFTHPLNRLDLPFLSTSGIIDSDKFFHDGGNYPFYLYKNEKIFIPAGTPMYQIIPVKRDGWKSVYDNFNEILSLKRRAMIHRHFMDSYKKFFRQKKIYK